MKGFSNGFLAVASSGLDRSGVSAGLLLSQESVKSVPQGLKAESSPSTVNLTSGLEVEFEFSSIHPTVFYPSGFRPHGTLFTTLGIPLL